MQYLPSSLCLSVGSSYLNLPPLYKKRRYAYVITLLCVYVHERIHVPCL
jgi:hypothetical protein